MRWGMSFHAPLLGCLPPHQAQVFIPSPPHRCLVCPEQGNRLGKLSWGSRGDQQEESCYHTRVACPPSCFSKTCRCWEDQEISFAGTRALQRSPFPIQPASLYPSNTQGPQVPLLPFLPPRPPAGSLCPLLLGTETPYKLLGTHKD